MTLHLFHRGDLIIVSSVSSLNRSEPGYSSQSHPINIADDSLDFDVPNNSRTTMLTRTFKIVWILVLGHGCLTMKYIPLTVVAS